MTWFMNGQPIPAGSANFTINPTSTEVTASSILLIRENFDATYECRTTFNAPVVISPVVANNTPDYFKTCTISRENNFGYFTSVFYVYVRKLHFKRT